MSSEHPLIDLSLDHVTIVGDQLAELRDFLCDVVGLVEGPRPPFSVLGHWLYADGRPVIHLIAQTVPAGTGRVSPRIDHVALRVHGAGQWDALCARVQSSGLIHTSAVVPLTGERQLFVQLAPSVVFEFVGALDTQAFPPVLNPRHNPHESQA